MHRIAKFHKVSLDQFLEGMTDEFPEYTQEDIRDIYDSIELPRRATKGSAGYDFFAPFSFSLPPGSTIKVPTGIRAEMEEDWVLKLYPRSGLGFKYRLQLNNTVGVIDSDYFYSDNEGHIFVKLTNDSNEGKTVDIGAGTGFIQGIFMEYGITVDADHPRFVYIPCGVGGAPGGVAFGFKQLFGDNVHVFFIEPTQAPCMLVGMASGLQNEVSVQDFGLSGQTHADGLAVGRASGFVGGVMKNLLSGILSLEDYHIYDLMRDIVNTEDIFLEPSACASFWGPIQLKSPEMQAYIEKMGLKDKMANAVHIPWATGGSLVPAEIREEYMHTHLK